MLRAIEKIPCFFFLMSISTCYTIAYAEEELTAEGNFKNEIAEFYDEKKGVYTLDDEIDNPMDEVKDSSTKSDISEKEIDLYINNGKEQHQESNIFFKNTEEQQSLILEEIGIENEDPDLLMELNEKKRPLARQSVEDADDEEIENVSSIKCCFRDIDSECRNAGRVHRISISNREGNGIGYPTGYSSLNLFFSNVFSNSFSLFTDLRGHYFNDGQKAANAGIGMRRISDRFQVVYGGNIFYDYRRTHHTTMQQIGAGLEVLGTLWALRVNGYFPFHNRTHLYGKPFFFAGHRGIFQKNHELAFTGVDALVSRLIFKRKYIDLEASAGAYYFNASFGKNAGGGLLRLSANISPYLALEVQGSYDSVFKAIGQGQISLVLPFGKRLRCIESCGCPRDELSLEERLVDSIARFEIIVADKHKRRALAINPITGDPYNFIFVNNISSDGDGTFENPFGTLFAAENNSGPGDVIYVFPGDGTTNGMNLGIALQNNQILQGSGTSLPTALSLGYSFIPPQTSNSPSIDNITGADTVSLSGDNLVNGFNISSTGGGMAISGSGLTGASITNNSLTSGVNLQNSSGNFLINNNNFNTSSAIVPLTLISLSGNVQITSNTITTQGLASSVVINNFQGVLNVSSNTISNATFGINVGGTLNTSFTINNNVISQIIGGINNNGIEIAPSSGTSSGTIANNQISDVGSGGIKVSFAGDAALLPVNILNNSVSFTAGNGIEVSQPDPGANDPISLKLAFNQSNVGTGGGYFLLSQGLGAFEIQSPNLMLSGVENINAGTFVTAGIFVFIPFVP